MGDDARKIGGATVPASGRKITPSLWFDDEAEDAAAFYVSVFDDARLGAVTRYGEAAADAAGKQVGSTLAVSFELEGQGFEALDGGPQFAFTPAVSFVVNCPTAEEVDDLWERLSEGGEELMPLDSYPFSDRYAWIEDEYGVSWQLLYDDAAPERRIVPSLMFTGEQCGRAAEAVDFYTAIFDDAAVGEVARYGPDQQPNEEGTVLYADFRLAGQRFAAMDSAEAHDFGFTEAISFVVDCADQAEVDYYWEELAADGGKPGRCGWLTDTFGVSWQVVPSVLSDLLRDEDVERSERVAEAMLGMGKLDVDSLERAYAGE